MTTRSASTRLTRPRVRVRDDEGPQTAAEEEKARRRAAAQAAEVRRLYEEMVLNKPKEELVQIGQPRA